MQRCDGASYTTQTLLSSAAQVSELEYRATYTSIPSLLNIEALICFIVDAQRGSRRRGILTAINPLL